ncbi:diguanylate cyclase [Aliikangiella maris]|uniref:diguanylate cyclase n=2 Tax=Aliikangiella maris TaxID=3162458 RepID=A0ABV2BYV5_9GAMM
MIVPMEKFAANLWKVDQPKSAKFYFLMLIACLLILLSFQVSGSLTPPHRSSSQPIVLQDNWQFCPVQNFQPDVDLAVLNCQPIKLPIGWESVQKNYDGYGLLTTTFEVPKTFENEALAIFIARLRDADKLFINNKPIGEMGEFPPNFQKAVLYSRLYPIPHNIIEFGKTNSIKIWIYNDARPGGITHSVPIIDSQFNLLTQFYLDNYGNIALMLILTVFSLIHFIYYLFHRHSIENFTYAIFLLCWSAYLFTYSNIAPLSDISMNLLFRSNVTLFFAIFGLFPLFIYQFFRQQIPVPLKAIIGIALGAIPISFMLPEPKLLYYPLYLIEILTIPAVFYIYWLLYKALKARLSYAVLMSTVILLYTLFGGIDVAVDFLQFETLTNIQLYGPRALIMVCIALTLIVSHKNFVYFKDATIDKLTNTLRYSEFLPRLDQELFRADRENKLLAIIMVDLDNFKVINDKFGHIQGDEVLKQVASCIQAQLRQFDLVCRYGGDEFCIAALMDNKKEIHQFVARLHQAVNQLSFEKAGQTQAIQATFGAEIRVPKQQASPQSLIESADDLLIIAKKKTKGTVFWQRSYPRISSGFSPPVDA